MIIFLNLRQTAFGGIHEAYVVISNDLLYVLNVTSSV